MAHTQKPDFVFRQKGRVHLNRLGGGRQFSQLLAAEVRASAVVMLDISCSEVVWRVLATHLIRQFPLHFPSCASPCAITFQLNSTHCVSGFDAAPEGVDILCEIWCSHGNQYQDCGLLRHDFMCFPTKAPMFWSSLLSPYATLYLLRWSQKNNVFYDMQR